MNSFDVSLFYLFLWCLLSSGLVYGQFPSSNKYPIRTPTKSFSISSSKAIFSWATPAANGSISRAPSGVSGRPIVSGLPFRGNATKTSLTFSASSLSYSRSSLSSTNHSILLSSASVARSTIGPLHNASNLSLTAASPSTVLSLTSANITNINFSPSLTSSKNVSNSSTAQFILSSAFPKPGSILSLEASSNATITSTPSLTSFKSFNASFATLSISTPLVSNSSSLSSITATGNVTFAPSHFQSSSVHVNISSGQSNLSTSSSLSISSALSLSRSTNATATANFSSSTFQSITISASLTRSSPSLSFANSSALTSNSGITASINSSLSTSSTLSNTITLTATASSSSSSTASSSTTGNGGGGGGGSGGPGGDDSGAAGAVGGPLDGAAGGSSSGDDGDDDGEDNNKQTSLSMSTSSQTSSTTTITTTSLSSTSSTVTSTTASSSSSMSSSTLSSSSSMSSSTLSSNSTTSSASITSAPTCFSYNIDDPDLVSESPDDGNGLKQRAIAGRVRFQARGNSDDVTDRIGSCTVSTYTVKPAYPGPSVIIANENLIRQHGTPAPSMVKFFSTATYWAVPTSSACSAPTWTINNTQEVIAAGLRPGPDLNVDHVYEKQTLQEFFVSAIGPGDCSGIQSLFDLNADPTNRMNTLLTSVFANIATYQNPYFIGMSSALNSMKANLWAAPVRGRLTGIPKWRPNKGSQVAFNLNQLNQISIVTSLLQPNSNFAYWSQVNNLIYQAFLGVDKFLAYQSTLSTPVTSPNNGPTLSSTWAASYTDFAASKIALQNSAIFAHCSSLSSAISASATASTDVAALAAWNSLYKLTDLTFRSDVTYVPSPLPFYLQGQQPCKRDGSSNGTACPAIAATATPSPASAPASVLTPAPASSLQPPVSISSATPAPSTTSSAPLSIESINLLINTVPLTALPSVTAPAVSTTSVPSALEFASVNLLVNTVSIAPDGSGGFPLGEGRGVGKSLEGEEGDGDEDGCGDTC